MKLLTILCALCVLCDSFARAAERRPNFLFIYTDDHRWDAMGVVQREHGERARFPWFASPGMDRLAAEGVRFRNAFVTLSLCAPSRAAFLTGRYNHANGITNNGTPFPADSVTHATLLRVAGYKTAYIGKWHMGNQRERPGFDYTASYIGHGRYQDCPFEINGTTTPTKGWVDDVAADLAIEYMKQSKTQPFSVVLGFKSPHSPRGGKNLPERLRGLYADKTTRPVPNLRVPSPWQKPLADGEPARGLADNAVHLDYLRHIAGVDENIARLLTALDELGLTENTVVVYTSDNGYFLGEHSSGDKRALYDESLRVPFLVRYPRLFGKGRTVDEMVLNVDLAPTFLDLAGVPVPPEMQGASWKKLAAGEKPAHWRTSFFAEYFKELGEVPTCYAVRTTTHKLVRYPNRPEWTELFDLTTDPYEIKNLAADSALAAKLDTELTALMKTVNYTVPADPNKPRETAPPAKEPIPAPPAEPTLEQLQQKARQGDAAARAALAIRYRDGKGVAKDDAEAMLWAHRAADAGDADAMDFVGHAYLRGAVVKRNPVVAFGYFKAAAEKSAQAAFNLGQCYFGAQGTEQDCAKSLEWWTKAAAKGHGRAASTAAMALLSGEGVAPDVAEARRLAERAAELNDPSGLIVLGELQFQAGELDAAKANWTKASKLHPTTATGHPAQPSGNASAQQGADLLKLIEYRQRKAEPGKFVFVPMPHIHQGYNNCGSTACATFARFQGGKIGGWDFKKLCPSPLGTGTDWWHLLDASAKIGQRWKLVTYTPDDDGFEKATAMLKTELDAGRPVVVDFKYIGPQYAGGFAGHTLSVCGYIAAENLYILCNPAVATPGLQLITAADLKDFWRSDYYGSRANAVLSRPAFVIEKR